MSLTLEDSTTYQWILEKGVKRGEAVGEARGEARGEVRGRIAGVLRLGTKRFGEPSPSAAERLAGLTDVALLDRLLDRVLDAASWDDLLSAP